MNRNHNSLMLENQLFAHSGSPGGDGLGSSHPLGLRG